MNEANEKHKLDAKDWIIITLGIIILLLGIGCGIYYHKYQKAEGQITIWNDSTYFYKNKYGEEYAFYGYNGGEKAIKLVKMNKDIEDPQPESLLFKVRDYNKKVRNKLAKTNSELDLYINQFKTAKAVEMASEIMSEFYHNEITSSMLDKDINKFGNKHLFYIRREDLAYLELEEIGIICNSKIGSFDVQTA